MDLIKSLPFGKYREALYEDKEKGAFHYVVTIFGKEISRHKTFGNKADLAMTRIIVLDRVVQEHKYFLVRKRGDSTSFWSFKTISDLRKVTKNLHPFQIGEIQAKNLPLRFEYEHGGVGEIFKIGESSNES